MPAERLSWLWAIPFVYLLALLGSIAAVVARPDSSVLMSLLLILVSLLLAAMFVVILVAALYLVSLLSSLIGLGAFQYIRARVDRWQINVQSRASDPIGIRLDRNKLHRLCPEYFEIGANPIAWLDARLGRRAADVFLVQDQLNHGDSRAAVVVSVSPLLVAAYTDELDCVALLRFPDEFARDYGLRPFSRLLTVNWYWSGVPAPDLEIGPLNLNRYGNFQPLIADNLAKHVVDPLFQQWETIDGGLALLALYAFAFQIYCDFSGYTDAARGIAKCLGFELSLNFNLPYFASSPQEFWSRWHISLSNWLRDYLYIPLGGNRGSKVKLYRNLLLTMIIGGLWHGAAWTFVLWGSYQGALLVGHRLARPWLDRIRPRDAIDRACWKLVRIAATFHLICFGWLLFRAQSLAQVGGMLRAIIERPAIPAASYLLIVAVVVLPLLLYQALQYLSKDLDVILRTPWYVRGAFYTACFYAFVLGGEFGGGQFLYFQF
jgi:hypothetical protein